MKDNTEGEKIHTYMRLHLTTPGFRQVERITSLAIGDSNAIKLFENGKTGLCLHIQGSKVSYKCTVNAVKPEAE